MRQCEHHTWNQENREPCWRCEELKYKDRIDTLKAMKDKCVMCGKETEYNVTDSVHVRYNYVEGAGQMCRDCAGDNINEVMINIPSSMIKETPNDMELGSKIRRLLS